MKSFAFLHNLCSSLHCACTEPENLELRQYIQRLDARINMQCIQAKQDERWKDVNKYSNLVDQ